METVLGDDGLAPRVVGADVGLEAPDGDKTGKTKQETEENKE